MSEKLKVVYGHTNFDNWDDRTLDDVTPAEWDRVANEYASSPYVYSYDNDGGYQPDYFESQISFDFGDSASGIAYKYNEKKLIDEFREYVDATYSQHYSQEKYQATEFIIDGGHGEGFCIGNILKYAQRYGRKGTPEESRKDLLKVLHYALIMLHVHDEAQSK